LFSLIASKIEGAAPPAHCTDGLWGGCEVGTGYTLMVRWNSL
jgi:hypothetical protein